VQRVKPIKKTTQKKHEFFIKDVAAHLRSTTKAKNWSEWELDKNFEIFCNQVHEYEKEQSSMRWLECEDQAWDHAKMLMVDEKTSTGALSFKQARTLLVEKFDIRIQNNALMNLLQSSRNGNISRVQHMLATYRRLAGPATSCNKKDATQNCQENLQTENPKKGMEIGACSVIDGGTANQLLIHIFAEALLSEPRQSELNDETIAALLLQRTVNQAWKQRFADMMDSIDAKDLVRAACSRNHNFAECPNVIECTGQKKTGKENFYSAIRPESKRYLQFWFEQICRHSIFALSNICGGWMYGASEAILE
jgi:hypothetical protein